MRTIEVANGVGAARKLLQKGGDELLGLATKLRLGRVCSFPANTPVLMCDGTSRPIQDVEEGDWVVAQDDETGALGCQQVVDPYANPGRALIALELRRDDGTTELLETTDNHPFYVDGRGWTRTDELSPGDRVPAADGGMLTVASIAWTGERSVVFNFGVEEFHSYFVGESGAWVHNCWKILTDDPKATFSKSSDAIVEQLEAAGYQVTYHGPARSSRATRISVEGGPADAGASKISQVLIHGGGGRHGGPYVKISTGEGTKKIIGPDYVKTGQSNVEYFEVE